MRVAAAFLSKGKPMATSNKSVLVVNVLYWVVAAALHPLASLLPTSSGETPKVYSLFIPLAFIGLAYGSTYMMALALSTAKKP